MPLHRRILLSSPSDGTDLPSSSRQIHINVIIAAASAAAASLFLALIYYSILRRRRRTSIPSIHPASDVDATLAARDNPFWHVKTIGLDDSAIEALGSYAYRPAGGADVVCSVCLAEILDGETVRLLPRCGHVFHLLCVDTWLRCHVSCPLCRAAVGVAGPTVEDVEVAIAVDPQLEEGDEGEGEIGVRVRVSLEIPESSGGGVRSNSLDSAAMGGFLVGVEEEKEGDCSNSCKEEGSEKGRSESGRNLWFPRLGRAKSSSILRL